MIDFVIFKVGSITDRDIIHYTDTDITLYLTEIIHYTDTDNMLYIIEVYIIRTSRFISQRYTFY